LLNARKHLKYILNCLLKLISINPSASCFCIVVYMYINSCKNVIISTILLKNRSLNYLMWRCISYRCKLLWGNFRTCSCYMYILLWSKLCFIIYIFLFADLHGKHCIDVVFYCTYSYTKCVFLYYSLQYSHFSVLLVP